MFFFFSSRRRHTRSDRDWSSDVCSSDLIEREPGLSDILVGSVQWQDCIRTVADILMGRFEMEDIMAAPGLDNLHIIEAGPGPANPSELPSAPAVTGFLHPGRGGYHVVLVGTPPILPVTPSALVA